MRSYPTDDNDLLRCQLSDFWNSPTSCTVYTRTLTQISLEAQVKSYQARLARYERGIEEESGTWTTRTSSLDASASAEPPFCPDQPAALFQLFF